MELQKMLESLIKKIGGYEHIIYNIIYSIIILLFFMLIKKIINKSLYKNNHDLQKKYKVKKKIGYIINCISFLLILIVWYDSFTYIVTFLGLFTAGLAIAMKEPLVNIAGGIYIFWSNPFKVGDRIEIGNHIGDVVDIQLFQFTLLEVGNRINSEQSTGRIIHIPNMLIFSQPLSNYEKGFKYIWNEITVPLDLHCNWQLAKEILLEIANKHSAKYINSAENQIKEAGKRYMIYYANLSPIVYTKIENGKIILTIRYLCEPRQTRNTEQCIWEDILTLFNGDEDITIV